MHFVLQADRFAAAAIGDFEKHADQGIALQIGACVVEPCARAIHIGGNDGPGRRTTRGEGKGRARGAPQGGRTAHVRHHQLGPRHDLKTIGARRQGKLPGGNTDIGFGGGSSCAANGGDCGGVDAGAGGGVRIGARDTEVVDHDHIGRRAGRDLLVAGQCAVETQHIETGIGCAEVEKVAHACTVGISAVAAARLGGNEFQTVGTTGANTVG